MSKETKEWKTLEGLIRSRRSVRKWKPIPVDAERVKSAIELACWAPNAGNQQPWKFIIIKDHAKINQIAKEVQAKNAMLASWPEAQPFSAKIEQYQYYAQFFQEAPLCIACLVAKYSSLVDQILTARGEEDEDRRNMRVARNSANSGIQSVSAAISYLLLILQQMGLRAVWMTGPVIAKKEIENLLSSPEGYDFIALIAVGYSDESPEAHGRKPIDEVVQIC